MNRNEVDAWWGSYSIWSVLPGFVLACVVSATAWAVILMMELTGAPLRAVTLILTLLWLSLALRWGYCIFGYRYRLTTRRLFREQGLIRRKVQQVDLEHVSAVALKQGPLEKIMHVGRVQVLARGNEIQTVTLNGVFAPEHLVEKIRALCRAARSKEPR